jgi:rhodanese-related sulfurtransferase
LNSDPDSKRQFKDAVYGQLARLGKALSSGPRLEILDLLTQGPRTVEAIAAEVGQTVANTSHHLRTLARARLVQSDRSGLYVTYRVADHDISALFVTMRALAERQFRELREATARFLDDHGSHEPIDARALAQRLGAGDITLIDVRPPSEYAAGHLPGSINLPIDELEARIPELPADRDIVAYCRGPFCVMAVDAATTLRARGLRALPFDRSVADWRALGLPVETAAEPPR